MGFWDHHHWNADGVDFWSDEDDFECSCGESCEDDDCSCDEECGCDCGDDECDCQNESCDCGNDEILDIEELKF